MPTLHLKWRAFQAFVDDVSSGKSIAESKLFPELADPDGDPDRSTKADSKFAKRLRGDVGLEAEFSDALVDHMNHQISGLRKRKGVAGSFPLLTPSDLELSTFGFAARLLELWPGADAYTLERMHKSLLEGLRAPPSDEGTAVLVVDRFDMTRSFGPDVLPSGGQGPLVFEVGRHKGQVAVLGETKTSLAAFTVFVRDPAPVGKHLWELPWGEAVLWLPAPSRPSLDGDRLLLMSSPQPVQPKPGRFTVTTALVWSGEALDELDPRSKSIRPDENETAQFLTKLGRFHKYRRHKWAGAVTTLSAEYLVKA
ncbi:hypothetical protein [Methylosinus sp. sav-2]|jgi:hypothetical protein|uniref:hypothetical protein n=1 Tax=Methylosinus sp. sav-2 TaxID=2485168 RepID=UPI00047E2550|nr:hypothetical protein [Methylosinus sp. sav-2]